MAGITDTFKQTTGIGYLYFKVRAYGTNVPDVVNLSGQGPFLSSRYTDQSDQARAKKPGGRGDGDRTGGNECHWCLFCELGRKQKTFIGECCGVAVDAVAACDYRERHRVKSKSPVAMDAYIEATKSGHRGTPGVDREAISYIYEGR